MAFARPLQRCWQLVENSSASQLTLQVAATKSGIGKNHLNVRLCEVTGLTFHQLLVRHRLCKAVALIAKQDGSFDEIALEVGFEGERSLRRNFQTILGYQPKFLRKLLLSRCRNKNFDGCHRNRDFCPVFRDFRPVFRDFCPDTGEPAGVNYLYHERGCQKNGPTHRKAAVSDMAFEKEHEGKE
jgi:AraC-like DNA-binding protein